MTWWHVGCFFVGAIGGFIGALHMVCQFQAALNPIFTESPERKKAMPHKIKLNLVEDWRNAWRWVSVKCMVLGGAIQGAWIFIPDDMKASIPPNVVQYVTLALLAVGVAGRVTKQPDLPK